MTELLNRANELLKSLPSINPTDEQHHGCSILFSDGEISYSKAGSLWGKRSLHCFNPALTTDTDILNRIGIEWPDTYLNHGCVFFQRDTEDKVNELRAIIGEMIIVATNQDMEFKLKYR